MRMPAASASGAMVLRVLARENLGRRHQRGLAAGLDHRGRREQRDDGLAGADIALEQAQHALGLAEIGIDGGDRPALAAGQFGTAAPPATLAWRRASWARARPPRRRIWARTRASASWPASISS